MSKRRKSGDWVWLMPNSGFVKESHKLQAQILPEEFGTVPCMLECGDPECREWSTLRTDICPDCGKHHYLYHVSECQMLDHRW